MPVVTGNVRTWGMQPFPADEKLIVWFIPSEAASDGSTIHPLRKEGVEPNSTGGISVTLAETMTTRNDVFFRVVLEWFERDRLNEKWVTRGRSDLPGELRVPAAGGDLADLLSVIPRPGSILHGFGPAPKSLRGVQYVDTSGMKPGLYLPKGSRI